ncbi:MAG: Fic family protein [Patescibacteria group bacterium]
MDQEFTQFNARRGIILRFFKEKKRATISQLVKVAKEYPGIKVSKITINRDLSELIRLGWIKRIGKARATFYELAPEYETIREINVNNYFKIDTDKRQIIEKFNFNIFDLLKKVDIFAPDGTDFLKEINNDYIKNIKSIPRDIIKREFERLIIDLSWKSSKIEGNTYSLLETENLIKKKKEAKGKTKEEATMIINHKIAFDYILKNKNNFKKISISKIEDVHYLLTKGLKISRNLRRTAIGITGTNYMPLDNQYQIREAMESTCKLVNSQKDSFAKGLILMIMIAYIQPFTDGNKRTSRMLGNAILLANSICPLSYRSADEIEYKKAVILFYELNNIRYFRTLFITQFMFAVKNYFRVKIKSTINK